MESFTRNNSQHLFGNKSDGKNIVSLEGDVADLRASLENDVGALDLELEASCKKIKSLQVEMETTLLEKLSLMDKLENLQSMHQKELEAQIELLK